MDFIHSPVSSKENNIIADGKTGKTASMRWHNQTYGKTMFAVTETVISMFEQLVSLKII